VVSFKSIKLKPLTKTTQYPLPKHSRLIGLTKHLSEYTRKTLAAAFVDFSEGSGLDRENLLNCQAQDSVSVAIVHIQIFLNSLLNIIF